MNEDVRIGEINLNIEDEIPIEVDAVDEAEEDANDIAGSVTDAMSGLNEKIEKLAVELKFMHDENDNLRLSLVRDKAALTKAYEATILKKEKEHCAKLNEEIAKEASLKKTYEAKIREKDEEIHQKGLENAALKKELEGKLDVVEVPGVCGCRHLETHDCDWVLMQKKIDSLDQELNNLGCEKANLDKQLRTQEADSMIELSRKLEELQAKCEKDLQEKHLLLTKTEAVVKVKDELLDARQELVENLKIRFDTLEKEISNNRENEKKHQSNLTSNAAKQDMVPRSKMVDLTNHYDAKIKLISEESEVLRSQLAETNMMVKKLEEVHPADKKVESTNKTSVDKNSADQNASQQSQANGLRECCEYLEVHATNGCITNGFLLWADIQRKQQPLNIWKTEAEKCFLKEEITEAKESLWRVAGEQALGRIVNRKGTSKTSSEINDICDALNILSEADKIPMFICTSSMVARTPIYQSDPDKMHETMRLDGIDQSLKTIIDMIDSRAEKTDNVQKSNDVADPGSREINTALGGTIPVVDIAEPDVPSNQEWTRVPQRNQRWRSNGNPPPGQTSLVVSGVKLGTRGMQIAHYFGNNGDIEICNWELLTKRENATFLTFKIMVKNNDAGKLKDPSLWPEGWRIRPYNTPSAKKIAPRRKYAAPTNQIGVTSNAQPTGRNPENNATTVIANRANNTAQYSHIHNAGPWNGMRQASPFGNTIPDMSPEVFNLNTWNGQGNASMASNIPSVASPGNYSESPGLQHANTLVGQANMASGTLGNISWAGGIQNLMNDSAARNTPVGASSRTSNLDTGMQLANPQMVSNVPSSLSPGYPHSRSTSMGNNGYQRSGLSLGGDMQWNNVSQHGLSPLMMQQQYREPWGSQQNQYNHHFPKLPKQVKILDRVGVDTFAQQL